MEILSKLFGSSARVKILRLFLFNKNKIFDINKIAYRTKVSVFVARKELVMMENIEFVKRKIFYKTVERISGSKTIKSKRKVAGWIVNEKFLYLKPLYQFLINATPLKSKEIEKRINRIGAVKLIIVSGVFIQDWDSRVDMLIVGDKLKKSNLESTIKSIEAEVGKELRYATFSTEDFKYRLNIYDKLVRDILDYPHEVVMDRIGFFVDSRTSQ
ncbi:hypothetical protein IIB50_02955 [Patescibacteria group bacterium]|nr:hypothetical protein [Patescibacteria group bacterium]